MIRNPILRSFRLRGLECAAGFRDQSFWGSGPAGYSRIMQSLRVFDVLCRLFCTYSNSHQHVQPQGLLLHQLQACTFGLGLGLCPDVHRLPPSVLTSKIWGRVCIYIQQSQLLLCIHTYIYIHIYYVCIHSRSWLCWPSDFILIEVEAGPLIALGFVDDVLG